MSLRTPLGRVLGQGSAKEGVHHWWVQRLTSLALIPLGIWFVVALLALSLRDRAAVIGWVGQGWNALLLILFALVSARHSQLGVQVVIEDYMHGHGSKAFALITSTFIHVLLAAAAVFAILKMAFGPTA